jgi:transcriptional regulator of NAD metabolism
MSTIKTDELNIPAISETYYMLVSEVNEDTSVINYFHKDSLIEWENDLIEPGNLLFEVKFVKKY